MEETKKGRDLTNGEVKLQIKNLLKQREQSRKNFLKKNPDAVFKRTTYDNLEEKGMLNPDSILNEYNVIKEKKSKLSSEERYEIMRLMSMAIQKAIIKQMKDRQKANTEEETKTKL